VWRELHDLFPGVDRSGALLLRSRTAPVDAAAAPGSVPAAASCALSAAAPSSAPTDAPQLAGHRMSRSPQQACDAPASAPGECRAFGCDEPAAGDWTGRCEAHSEVFLDRARCLTHDVGRGMLP